MRVVWISVLTLILFLKTSAQTVELRGIISDEQGKPVSFASVWINAIHQGTLTNEQGFYRLYLNPGSYTLSFRSPGYKPLFQTIRIEGRQVNHDLQLSHIVKSNQFPYAADSIIRQVIARQNNYPDRLNAYSGYLYTKSLQRLNETPKNFLKNGLAFQLRMNPDSKGIINFSESMAEVQINSGNGISKKITAAIMTNNSRDLFNFNKLPELHIDFYQNTLNLNGINEHAFISPLSDHALTYYRYQLIGQFTDQQRVIDEILVLPIRTDQHLFNGMIYIIDKEWLLYSIDLHLSRNAHIDFIDSVRISQQYVPVNNNWLTQAMQFSFKGRFMGFKYSGLFLQVYQDIHADTLKADQSKDIYHSTMVDYQKDKKFWEQNRPLLLTPEEERFYLLTKQEASNKKGKILSDSLQNKNNRFYLFPYLLWGYTLQNYSNNSSITIQSPINIAFYNTVEGWGADLKVKYTRVYDRKRSLTIIPDVRYGFSDHVFNANLLANYMYNPLRYASVYGRIGTDFLDLNNTGTISLFLNSLSTLYLGNNYIKLYKARFIMAGTSGEIASGILLNGQVEYADRNSLFNTTLHTFNKDSTFLTSNNPLDPNANTPLFPHYRALTIRGSATITFNQEYMITPTGKFILPNPYPRVRINYRKGIPVMGSSVNYDFISIDVFQDKLNMGIYGYTAFFLSGGKFLNNKNLYYPDYNHFHGGQSFFFDYALGGFHFLNFYTYSTYKAYFEAHAEHNFTGILLNRIPMINKLGLQEIIGGSYLAQGTLPAYQEVYIGLKRTVIRLDYGLAFGKFSKIMQGFRLSYNFPAL